MKRAGKVSIQVSGVKRLLSFESESFIEANISTEQVGPSSGKVFISRTKIEYKKLPHLVRPRLSDLEQEMVRTCIPPISEFVKLDSRFNIIKTYSNRGPLPCKLLILSFSRIIIYSLTIYTQHWWVNSIIKIKDEKIEIENTEFSITKRIKEMQQYNLQEL